MNVDVLAMHPKNGKRMPKARLPLEIEYWYVLPVLRKELAKSLKDIGKLKQKEIAAILGISESAVSQYLKGTRATLEFEGKEIEIPQWLLEQIDESAKKILANKTDPIVFLVEINTLIQQVRASPTTFLCKIHKAFGIVEEECPVCLLL